MRGCAVAKQVVLVELAEMDNLYRVLMAAQKRLRELETARNRLVQAYVALSPSMNYHDARARSEAVEADVRAYRKDAGYLDLDVETLVKGGHYGLTATDFV